MLLSGLLFKVSSAPFHYWVADVYTGVPLFVTSIFGLLPKAGIVYVIYKLSIGLLSWSRYYSGSVLLYSGVLSLIIGCIGALYQHELKRLFAYSAIAHAGYLLLGLVVFSETGLFAMMIYLLAYLFMNLGAFYVVMLISDSTGSESIDDINGLGFTAPLLAVPLTIFFSFLDTGLYTNGNTVTSTSLY